MGNDSGQLRQVQRQMDTLIEFNNKLEEKVEKLGFDVRFLQAWAKHRPEECLNRQRSTMAPPVGVVDGS